MNNNNNNIINYNNCVYLNDEEIKNLIDYISNYYNGSINTSDYVDKSSPNYYDNNQIEENYLENKEYSNKNNNLIDSINDNYLKNQQNSTFNYDINLINIKKPCGIKNYGNNCYLNSGLQIIASCDKLVDELNNIKSNSYLIILLKKVINSLLNGDEKEYDPIEFLNYFCSYNNEFVGSQYCSQTFIRTLIKNINKELFDIKSENIWENNQYDLSTSDNKNKKFEYNQFIKVNKIFPETKILNFFSGIFQSFSNGECDNCKKK